MRTRFLFLNILVAFCLMQTSDIHAHPEANLLIIAKLESQSKEQLKTAVSAIKEMAKKAHWKVYFNRHDEFETDLIDDFDALIFLNMQDDLFDETQQLALERYMSSGGAFIGINTIASAYEWDWYGELIGASILDRSEIRKAKVSLSGDRSHPIVKDSPKKWKQIDEWCNLETALSENHSILLNVNESSNKGNEGGNLNPVSWCSEFSGGRAFVTTMGRTIESWSNVNFLLHLEQAINWCCRLD